MAGGESLESYLGGRWARGQDVETELIDPTNGNVFASASAKGLDLEAALAFARKRGGPALRALDYAERAKLLGAVADVLVANRARYEEIAIANSGNTKIDAAIDIDGGIGTLKYYARLGAGLGAAKALLDEKPVRLAKAENFQAIHILVPRHGVAVHINAFNFPELGPVGEGGLRAALRHADAGEACFSHLLAQPPDGARRDGGEGAAGRRAQPVVRRHRRSARSRHRRRRHRLHRLVGHRATHPRAPQRAGTRHDA